MGQFCKNYLISDVFKSFFKEVIDHQKGRLEINPDGLFDFNIC